MQFIRKATHSHTLYSSKLGQHSCHSDSFIPAHSHSHRTHAGKQHMLNNHTRSCSTHTSAGTTSFTYGWSTHVSFLLFFGWQTSRKEALHGAQEKKMIGGWFLFRLSGAGPTDCLLCFHTGGERSFYSGFWGRCPVFLSFGFERGRSLK
ncbi:hypothetical protein I3760_02G046900 [Carya illinoinensis]|nr:hypothetical protein I3760_02G046900 [Carya illinoinensis]